MEIKIKKLSEDAIIPRKATKGAAAYDVYVPQITVVHYGRQIIPLDIAISIPYGYEAKIEPRSGFASKGIEISHKLGNEYKERANADVIVGKIDSDYRGNIGVIIHSRELYPFTIEKGTRIAQMTIYKVEDADFVTVEELDETERGEGGFGHTGK